MKASRERVEKCGKSGDRLSYSRTAKKTFVDKKGGNLWRKKQTGRKSTK